LITGAAELSFLSEKPGARSDLDALSALDSNRDRKIDATDLRFGELKVWVDANRNGFTDAGELKTLQELNIASIDLAGAATQQSVKPGQNILLATGSFTLNDGTVRSLGDAALAFRPGRAGGTAASGAATDANALPPAGPGDELTGPQNPRPSPIDELELASAVRAGLGDSRASMGSSGLSFGLPPGVDPFDYFADPAQGAEAVQQAAGTGPDLQAATGGEDRLAAADAGFASVERKIALMVQTMAAFGRSQGEGELQNRDRDVPRFDYFA
ncbi:MAG TPA: hypothetical protein VF535_12050, partial [Allosphingosinicella sp.]